MVENPKFFVNVRFSFFDDRGTWYSVGFSSFRVLAHFYFGFRFGFGSWQNWGSGSVHSRYVQVHFEVCLMK